jgi:hypothetical protein
LEKKGAAGMEFMTRWFTSILTGVDKNALTEVAMFLGMH